MAILQLAISITSTPFPSSSSSSSSSSADSLCARLGLPYASSDSDVTISPTLDSTYRNPLSFLSSSSSSYTRKGKDKDKRAFMDISMPLPPPSSPLRRPDLFSAKSPHDEEEYGGDIDSGLEASNCVSERPQIEEESEVKENEREYLGNALSQDVDNSPKNGKILIKNLNGDPKGEIIHIVGSEQGKSCVEHLDVGLEPSKHFVKNLDVSPECGKHFVEKHNKNADMDHKPGNLFDDNLSENLDDVGPEPGKIFVGNIPPLIPKGIIAEHFRQFGPLKDLILIKDHSDPEKNKGYCFVIYGGPSATSSALKAAELNGTLFHGRKLTVKLDDGRRLRKKLESRKRWLEDGKMSFLSDWHSNRDEASRNFRNFIEGNPTSRRLVVEAFNKIEKVWFLY